MNLSEWRHHFIFVAPTGAVYRFCYSQAFPQNLRRSSHTSLGYSFLAGFTMLVSEAFKKKKG